MTEIEFAERLKQYRKAKGMTQQELADRLGVSNKSVSRWESGSYPDVATLGPLARILGVTVDDLLNEQAPIRTLERSDWQNLLSFAFTIGGGVLYFLLVLFTPVPVAYLLYLGAMAYGVYLQKHYTYHSKWFRTTNLLMSFFVNWNALWRLLSLFSVLMFSQFQFGAWMAQGPLESLMSGAGIVILPALLICLLFCIGLTALIDRIVHRYVGSDAALPSVALPKITPELVPMTRRNWVPAGLAALIAIFWILYFPTNTAILPSFLYFGQRGWYMVLLLICAAVCILTFYRKGHRRSLLPSLAFVGLCTALPNCLNWEYIYEQRRHLIYWSSTVPRNCCRIGRPTWGLWLLLLLFFALYLLCCHIRLRFHEKKTDMET